jgi:hypothetical protein
VINKYNTIIRKSDMNIRELAKPITAKSLNESLAKKFGTTIDVDKFTTEQLEDARNKIRTQLSQTETTESFDAVHSSSDYQKNKLFLDVLNAAIAERENMAEKAKPDYIDIDGDGDKKEPMKKAVKDKEDKKTNEVGPDDGTRGGQEPNRSDTPNLDAGIAGIDDYYDGSIKDKLGFSPTGELMKVIYKGMYTALSAAGIDMEPGKLKKAAMNAATTLESKQRNTKETQIIENYFAYATKLVEGEEDKAEIVMAAKDMVDRITGWMEDTAEMQTESMLELGDAIRDEMGQAQSESFIQVVKPALESLFTALESTRGALTGGVGQLTGEAEPAVDMGAQNEMPADDTAEPEMEPTVDAEAGDDFVAAEPAAGGADEAGRAKRESIDLSRRLGTILSSKKK